MIARKQRGIPATVHCVTSETASVMEPAAVGLNSRDSPCKPMKLASVATIAGMLR